jgi:hypothetical protein
MDAIRIDTVTKAFEGHLAVDNLGCFIYSLLRTTL